MVVFICQDHSGHVRVLRDPCACVRVLWKTSNLQHDFLIELLSNLSKRNVERSCRVDSLLCISSDCFLVEHMVDQATIVLTGKATYFEDCL
jgi:hypothetical protein